jgi:DNA-binding transcriptional ArsR family regulator
MFMDTLFKALNDTTRRALLDALRTKDGQSLTDLETNLEMSRFGVMKHLRVLEDANLVLTRKAGRFKYHYLNAHPLQEMVDRWVTPFLQPQARALSELKQKLERETTMGKPDFMMQTFIRCTQDALWNALTDPSEMGAYHFMCNEVRMHDSMLSFIKPDGDPMLKQEITSSAPKSRLELTFEPLFMGPEAPASHMVYMIEPQGDQCKLTIEHYDMASGQEGFAEGWARLSSSLKSYLETGSALKLAM